MVYEILNENENKDRSNKAISHIERMYQHCLKWFLQPSKQGPSWVKTIIEASRSANNEIGNSINVKRYVENNLEKAYKTGKLYMQKETNIIKESDNDVYVMSSFNSVEKITNEQYVRDWLIRNAYNEESINAVNNKK